jgi:CRP/FNR family cyclic AMP-dependent transcriptional regulator
LASIVPLLKEKTFYKDEILFSQGEIGDAFYLIKTGSISVLANNIEVAVLGPGEGIGEMALIEGETRSATALLKEDSQLFKLSSNDFNKLLTSYSSITISLLKTLSQRLRIRAAKLT